MYHLEFPNISHKSRYVDMIEEWKSFEEVPTSPGRLFVGENYEDFLKIITNDVTNSTVVNSTLYFFMENDEILGSLQIRHSTDHPNLSIDGGAGGHIGYGLRPSARGKLLSKEMLLLGLEEARKLGISEVMISAFSENIASWKTIERCDGILQKAIIKEGKDFRIYMVDLVGK